MKKVIAVLILCLGLMHAQAQEVYNSSGRKGEAKFAKKETGFDPSRIIFGGGLGLGFGSGYFYGSLSPVVGYAITDNFSAGVGLSFQYYRNKFDAVSAYDYNGNYAGEYQFDRKSYIYTASIWARYIVWKNLFVHVQPEMLNVDKYENFTVDNFNVVHADNVRQWVPAALVGLGIRQPITERASLVLLALYDVIQDPNSPYYKTIDIRFGFNVGF